MIVVDTNVIAYFLVGGTGTFTAESEKLYQEDSDWHAPILWRSEFSNVLSLYVRRELMDLDDAIQLFARAERLMASAEHTVVVEDVLRLAFKSKSTAYDCEFISLANDLQTHLITNDERLRTAFPTVAITPEKYRSLCQQRRDDKK